MILVSPATSCFAICRSLFNFVRASSFERWRCLLCRLARAAQRSVAQDDLEEIWSVICLCLICVLKDGDHDKNRSYCAPVIQWLEWFETFKFAVGVSQGHYCIFGQQLHWDRGAFVVTYKEQDIHGITLVHLSFCWHAALLHLVCMSPSRFMTIISFLHIVYIPMICRVLVFGRWEQIWVNIRRNI